MNRSGDLNAEKRVLVLGASGLDVIGHLDADLLSGTSNPVRIRTSHGGVARNVAENLARLGQPVSLITVVGADQNGDDILRQTQEAGVDVSATLRTGEYPTGFYMGVLDTRRRLELAVDDMRLMSQLTPQHLKDHAGLFESADLLFVDANLPEESLEVAVKLAMAANLDICADTTSSSLAIHLLP
jgi:pseudouridine kinase